MSACVIQDASLLWAHLLTTDSHRADRKLKALEQESSIWLVFFIKSKGSKSSRMFYMIKPIHKPWGLSLPVHPQQSLKSLLRVSEPVIHFQNTDFLNVTHWVRTLAAR